MRVVEALMDCQLESPHQDDRFNQLAIRVRYDLAPSGLVTSVLILEGVEAEIRNLDLLNLHGRSPRIGGGLVDEDFRSRASTGVRRNGRAPDFDSHSLSDSCDFEYCHAHLFRS